MVLGPGRLPARPIYARALFSGRISMSELALRSRIAASLAARVYGAGSVTDFSALGGGRARPGVSRPPYESVLRPWWGDGV